jgi:hypothetical protein
MHRSVNTTTIYQLVCLLRHDSRGYCHRASDCCSSSSTTLLGAVRAVAGPGHVWSVRTHEPLVANRHTAASGVANKEVGKPNMREGRRDRVPTAPRHPGDWQAVGAGRRRADDPPPLSTVVLAGIRHVLVITTPAARRDNIFTGPGRGHNRSTPQYRRRHDLCLQVANPTAYGVSPPHSSHSRWKALSTWQSGE